MQRLLSLKLLSKAHKNLCSNTSSIQQVSSSNLFSLSKTIPIHLHGSHFQQHRHFFSRYTTCSHSWRSHNTVSGKARRFLSNFKELLWIGLSKSPSKGFIDRGVGFVRCQFQRRSLHYYSSFDSHRRGWQSYFRRFTTDGVVMGLIISNVAVFLLWRIADRNFMAKNFMISLDNFRSGRVHTVITSAFSHIDSWHLISNMIGFYFFGMNIGRVFGPEFLLKLYLSGAVVGSVFYLVHHAFMASSSKNRGMWSMDPSKAPGLGASGAVNAIMLLDIFLFPKNTILLEFFIPVPAILLGVFLIGKDMLRILEGDNQISGSAHLGGALVAAVAWARIRR